MKPNLTLYIGQGCPYCTNVLVYMEQNDIKIPTKDVWSDSQAMLELVSHTNRRQVPCLKIDDEWMFESLDIIDWLGENI